MEGVRRELRLGLQGPQEGLSLGVTILLVALGAANAVAFLVYGWDKLCAKLGRRRVSERMLLLLAALAAAPGAWLAMSVFRHKTQKTRFRVGVPLLAVVEAALAAAVFLECRRRGIP